MFNLFPGRKPAICHTDLWIPSFSHNTVVCFLSLLSNHRNQRLAQGSCIFENKVCKISCCLRFLPVHWSDHAIADIFVFSPEWQQSPTKRKDCSVGIFILTHNRYNLRWWYVLAWLKLIKFRQSDGGHKGWVQPGKMFRFSFAERIIFTNSKAQMKLYCLSFWTKEKGHDQIDIFYYRASWSSIKSKK